MKTKSSKLLLPIASLIVFGLLQLSGCTPKQEVTAEVAPDKPNQAVIADNTSKTSTTLTTTNETATLTATTTRKYEVFGMNCPGCHGGLEKLINKIDGVVSCKANWERQFLKVVFDSKTMVDDKLIYAAIKDANFTPGERLK